MSPRYDIVIAGLGPGGAMAAVELAKAGAKVLVLNAKPAKPKACGGCLSRRWEWLLRSLDLPESLWEHPVDRLWLAALGQPAVHWQTREPGAYLVDRAVLDQALAQAAQRAGAIVLPARVLDIEKNKDGFAIHSTAGKFQGAWLIGADGAGGASARALGFRRSKLQYRAIVEERPLPQEMRHKMKGAALIELGSVPGGYAWAFARGDVLNLGIGYWQQRRGRNKKRISTHDLASAYAGFLQRQGLGAPGSWRGWIIPCPDGRLPGAVSGRACLVGDAANAGDPFLGEGIGQALYSGNLAASAILEGDLALYNQGLRGLWREHRHGRLLARLIYGRPGFFQGLTQRRPGAIELGFAVLRGELAQARLWRAVLAKLLKLEPTLDPAARGYYSKHLN
jgi:geranylgeranyl reductase family protein